MTPCVSVIVPVYKVEPYLRGCLDSILAQTLTDIELIAVDDGSPDGCGAICDAYAEKDGRVRVIHKQNGGLISAWTAGLAAAAAPWVGFVDSDDWVDADYFADLYAAAQRTGAEVACAEYVRHAPEGDEVFARPEQTVLPAPDGGRRYLAQHYASISDSTPPIGANARWTKLYRRQLLLDNLGYFSTDVWHGEDLVTNAAVLADCACVVLLAGGAKYHYRIRSGSLTAGPANRQADSRWAENELAFLRAMGRIVRDKGLLPDCFCSFLGRTAYAAIVDHCALRGVSRSEKRRYMLQVLSLTPPETLTAYARERNSPFVTLYCALLRRGITAPCLAISALYSRLGPRQM